MGKFKEGDFITLDGERVEEVVVDSNGVPWYEGEGYGAYWMKKKPELPAVHVEKYFTRPASPRWDVNDAVANKYVACISEAIAEKVVLLTLARHAKEGTELIITTKGNNHD